MNLSGCVFVSVHHTPSSRSPFGFLCFALSSFCMPESILVSAIRTLLFELTCNVYLFLQLLSYPLLYIIILLCKTSLIFCYLHV